MSMTDEELVAAQAAITTLETEIADLTQTNLECINRAKEFNARGREAVGKRTSLQAVLKKARDAVEQEVTARAVESKRKANEEAIARAAEAKKAAEAAAAAKAAEPVQPSEMEQLRMEVTALRAELARK